MVAHPVGSAEHTLGTTAVDVFSHRGEGKMFVVLVKNVLISDFEKPGIFGVPN
jgi:hypothetical protein